ncbi:AAA-domain-containing protein [Coniophora puteana RWD-64-598 SS2]|uniref:AAA-domain-containing protein n=1 Tax=Coniophora puteana (strain RWD-64-598) TaxID=741705 RepID=A0A5M3MRM5_CONPW|nr:AAA-domain-containing protein [Coniophora puteana RWD-64-598 SS2]EIW81740.1 AAA-domain-containing protein [Coniophora puteana RWD-64-598 SS2]
MGGARAGGGHGGRRNKGPGWSASGAELSRWMGMAPVDDSDSDNPTRTPRKGLGAGALFGGSASGVAGAGGAGLLGGDPGLSAAAAGTPSNLGKVGDAALADADPLGVNQNVSFDEVGGLDDHIHQLKEMTMLPLLYPEMFQRFGLTPPRGVLFHGPPGTGKTLLARALAASCRSNGRTISFFMRKGADCLSKWVGEAERQLRLLFEEARASQPSIIFFDEIDGLAPVRSSKQDQIHASIVSTLLALMDGMDGRGQVVVIGATNRPDAVDPALRRPGRFDREFYFPLPTLEARERILGIMTGKWDGWAGEDGVEKVRGLARMTKGYGGADLRALCTEAALCAVQRRYPQIYESQERLVVRPESVVVGVRDFMISVKKLVPSSARSTASSASPLPSQLVPLLEETVDRVKSSIDRVLPPNKKRNALEEAQWEDEGEEGALEREMLVQSMETLRVYRPRLVLHGQAGMGQGYVGAAALHHLEGYHVQNLDLGSLMGDSARTPEAAIVQLFVEAKRHQPSVVYIPSLIGWCAAISESARTTVRAMLDSLSPTDPVLLLGIVDGPLSALPRDVRAWFGAGRENRVLLPAPTEAQREAFFEGLLVDVRRPPNMFADGVRRRKRVLEVLEIAPPLEPRQPSAAELAVQEEHDARVVTLLKYRLGPILGELKRKFKRFTKRATEEYDFDVFADVDDVEPAPAATVTVQAENAIVEIVDQQPVSTTTLQVNGVVNGDQHDAQMQSHSPSQMQPQLEGQMQTQAQLQLVPAPQQPQPAPAPAAPRRPRLYDMDLERMNMEIYRGTYLTPHDFLEDVGKIVHNALVHAEQDAERLWKAQAMYTAAEVSVQEFDPAFKVECERMAEREKRRRDERRKEKEKARAAANGNVNGGGAGAGAGAGEGQLRRSARNNGAQLELTITDPLQIERRAKRQRSTDRPSGSPMVEEQQNADGARPGSGHGQGQGQQLVPAGAAMDPEGRDSKRVRTNQDGGMLAGDGRPLTVRFASDMQQPMQNGYGGGSSYGRGQQGQMHGYATPAAGPGHAPELRPYSGYPQGPQYGPQSHIFNGMGMGMGMPHDDMAVDSPSPRKLAGFGGLLNPAGSVDHQYQSPANSIQHLLNSNGPSPHPQPDGSIAHIGHGVQPPHSSHPSLFPGYQDQPQYQPQHGYPHQHQPQYAHQQYQPPYQPPQPQTHSPSSYMYQQQPYQGHQMDPHFQPHVQASQPYPQPQGQPQSFDQWSMQVSAPSSASVHDPMPSHMHHLHPASGGLDGALTPMAMSEHRASSSPFGHPQPQAQMQPQPQPSSEPQSEPTPQPEPEQPPRTPTPPHPEFHVDEALLAGLKDDLRLRTAQLTVEQLEQLRATSLGCIWRHRAAWDRDALVRELKDVLLEFLDDVALDVPSDDEGEGAGAVSVAY